VSHKSYQRGLWRFGPVLILEYWDFHGLLYEDRGPGLVAEDGHALLDRVVAHWVCLWKANENHF